MKASNLVAALLSIACLVPAAAFLTSTVSVARAEAPAHVQAPRVFPTITLDEVRVVGELKRPAKKQVRPTVARPVAPASRNCTVRPLEQGGPGNVRACDM